MMLYYKNLEDIINEYGKHIFSSIKNVDEKFKYKELAGESRKVIHALFFPRKKLLLKRHVSVGSILPKEIVQTYDVFPLLMLEPGIIRGVRYSGKLKEDIEPRCLEIGKIDHGYLTHSLGGTFITSGKFSDYNCNNKDYYLSYILSHYPRLMGIKYLRGRFKSSVIFPSPSLSISTIVNNREYLVLPFVAYAIIDFTNPKYTSQYVVGKWRKDCCISVKMNFIIYNPNHGFQISNQFNAIVSRLLLEEAEDNILYEGFVRRKMIATSIMGMIESMSKFIIDIRSSKSYKEGSKKLHQSNKIIIFETYPRNLKLTLLYTIGDIEYLEYKLDNNRIKIPFYISVNKNKYIEVRKKFIVLFNHINKDIKADTTKLLNNEFLLSWRTGKHSIVSEEPDKIKVLIPPLISISELSNADVLKLYRYVRRKANMLRKIDLIYDGFSDEYMYIRSQIRNYRFAISIWERAFLERKRLMRKGLFITL